MIANQTLEQDRGRILALLQEKLTAKERLTMATKGKKLEAPGLSSQRMEEFVRKAVEDVLRCQMAGFGGLPHVVMEQREPLLSAIEPARYLQILDSRGEIVDISIEKIKERLAEVVGSIEDVAERAATAGKNIASRVSEAPFELDEVTVGLSITVKAGIVVVGVGGDVSLELKFVRRKGAGSGQTS